MNILFDPEHPVHFFQEHGNAHINALGIRREGIIIFILYIPSGKRLISLPVYFLSDKLRIQVFDGIKTAFLIYHRNLVPFLIRKQ